MATQKLPVSATIKNLTQSMCGISQQCALPPRPTNPFNGGTPGSGIGYAVGGPIGGVIGGGLGSAVGKAVQAAREAGIANVENLKTEALLNPALFQLLMTKATRQSEPGLMTKLAGQLRRISLIGGAQASQEAERQAEKVAPSPVASTAPGIPVNALFSAPGPAVSLWRNALSGM